MPRAVRILHSRSERPHTKVSHSILANQTHIRDPLRDGRILRVYECGPCRLLCALQWAWAHLFSVLFSKVFPFWDDIWFRFLVLSSSWFRPTRRQFCVMFTTWTIIIFFFVYFLLGPGVSCSMNGIVGGGGGSDTHPQRPKWCVSGQNEIIYIYHFCRLNVRARVVRGVDVSVATGISTEHNFIAERYLLLVRCACMAGSPAASQPNTVCVAIVLSRVRWWQRFHFGMAWNMEHDRSEYCTQQAHTHTTNDIPKNHYRQRIVLCEQFTALLVYWPQSAKHWLASASSDARARLL